MTSLETYIKELSQTRHAAVNETSYYGALANLINDIGKTLKPKVRYVITPKSLGAGLPDGGLYTAQQFQRGAEASFLSTPPERGCVEVKGLGDDVLKIALSAQVEKYLKRYRQALVTNYRDFLLVALDENGKAVNLERYTLAASEAEFWTAAAHTQAMAKEHGDRFTEYLKRVMLHAAPLASPEDVARFLASYARDAKARVEQKKDLPALNSLRSALEEALGLKFEGKDGEHFFRSTLVQTLFYGIFSAWVLWSRQHPKRAASDQARFDWRSAAWSLRVPMIRALFEQILMPSKLEQLGLVEVLDWAAMTLNRVEDPAAFIEKFTEGHAVQYFYEPFLQEFDPELRKQLGVWYTPTEIVKYMVARVDTALREELNLPEGLASENVYVLDPCCGTGAYLVEVLRHIEKTLKGRGEDATIGAELKRAAMNRVFGFEILPAPFVVAHLQLGLLLQTLDAPLRDEGDERVGVYLTNALTGWEPPKEPKTHLLFPELEEERDRAEEVKRAKPILVILGNPPYNAFAGTSPEEEQGLVEPYKEGFEEWGITRNTIDDLYVRFFRIAERRIAERTGRGVVCYISNHSWVSEQTYVILRQHLLSSFDRFWIENMHGNRKISEYGPDGKTSETVFAIQGFSPGIQQGVVISLWVKNNNRPHNPQVFFRDDINESKAAERRAHLLSSLKSEDFNAQYEIVVPREFNRFSFRPSSTNENYESWPSLASLSEIKPLLGLNDNRGQATHDLSKNGILERMRSYFDVSISLEEMAAISSGLTTNAASFDAKATRLRLQTDSGFDEQNVRRFWFKPFDLRWAYIERIGNLWNRIRPELLDQAWEGNEFLLARCSAPKAPDGATFYFSKYISDQHVLHTDAYFIPLRLRSKQAQKKKSTQNHFFADAETNDAPIANLSSTARAYLASLGIEDVDADAETAALIWMHALAIGYAPAYLAENADGIRNDWPRIPLPDTAEALNASAELGRTIAAILAYDAADPASKQFATRPPLNGIVGTKPRPELRVTGAVSRAGGGQLKPDAPHHELRVTAGWGHAGKGGVTMPGKGKTVARPYTDDERAAIAEGAASLGLTPGEAFASLGETTLDVYLNDTAYWRNIPARVWDYHIGGYQVIKKWLSYREHELLGRDLTLTEAAEVRDMARRIAALRLLEPALDANYRAIKEAAYAWPKD